MLLPVRSAPAKLVDVLAHGRAGFACAQHVLIHRTNVPRRAFGRGRPRFDVQRPEHSERAFQLMLLQVHGFVMAQWFERRHVDGRHGHDRGPLVRSVRDEGFLVAWCCWQWARNISIDSSINPVQRSPPGSLETCWSTSPVISAVHRSRCRALVTPFRANSSWVLARERTAGAYASGDGSNPGSVRWNKSWYRAGSPIQNSTKRRTWPASRARGSSPSIGSAILSANSEAAWPNMAS